MQNISIGIDGITTTVAGNIVSTETKLPNEENYFLILTPKGNRTEVSLILPKTIRIDNCVGFRYADLKLLDDAITSVTRQIKKYQRDIAELYIQQLEVACTVDLGAYDDVTINSLLKLFSDVLLVNQKQIENNKMNCSPQQIFMCSNQKKGYFFLKDKVIKSFMTNQWSNRRMKFKAYSKGAGSEFGGKNSIFRFEAVYNETGIRYILKKDANDTITLCDVLTDRAVRGCISTFKQDYREIVVSRLNGYLKELESMIFDKLHCMSAYNTLLVVMPYLCDINVYRRALKRYYKEQGKKDGAFRKMYSSVVKKLEKQENIILSDKVINILQLIGKNTRE